MDKRLEEIRARADAATEGPWLHTPKDCAHFMNSDFIDREGDDIGVGLVTSDINQLNATLYATPADMDFIAHARSDVPYLLDQLTRSQGRIAELEGVLADITAENLSRGDCVFCGSVITVEGHSDWCPFSELEQQPTTLTKEGGGGTKGSPEGGEEEAEFIRQAAKRAFEEQR